MTAVQLEYELLLKHRDRVLFDLAVVELAISDFEKEHKELLRKEKVDEQC